MERRAVVQLLGGFAVLATLGLAAAAGLAALARWGRAAPQGALPEAAVAADPHRLLALAGAAGPGLARDQIDQFGEGGFTALDWAARAGRVESIRILLAAGAQIDLRDHGVNGWTALMHAVHKHQKRAAQALLAAGAGPNARARNGTTPLLLVAGDGDPELVELLLAAGADPRAEDAGRTALTNAVAEGDARVVRALLRAAPDLRLRGTFWDRAAVWLARLRGRREALRLAEHPAAAAAAEQPQSRSAESRR
jgi:ankyrin repeat protein